MINRVSEKLLRKYARQFRSVAITGPRQSGKTTLARTTFPAKQYVSLENPDERMFAESDPRGFLNLYRNGAIIDEAQRVPSLFSYLQQILDETSKSGLFILTGSNNFLLQQSISQSLAGRIGYIDLLPLSLYEIQSFGKISNDTNELLLNGCYPEVYDKKIKPGAWYSSYLRTYVERDVRQLRNIDNTVLFTRFLKLCAGRIGQQLSLSAISNECGIDVKTCNSWLSILQSSYVIHLLPPHFKNFNKRVVKSPKLYFIDTGLACSLLGIRTPTELQLSHFRGALFENYVVIELLKQIHNTGSLDHLYYWRDNKGTEIDVLIDKAGKLLPVEIKSSQTFSEHFLRNILLWNSYSNTAKGIVLYDGKNEYTAKGKIALKNWRTAETLI